jgi:hypothetical protein
MTLGASLAALLLIAFVAGGCGSAGSTGSSTAAKESVGPCGGMTPREAARQFEAPARRAGVSAQFATSVVHPSAAVESSPGYPRLVASLYAVTLPVSKRPAAAAACAKELASSKEGRASSTRAK